MTDRRRSYKGKCTSNQHVVLVLIKAIRPYGHTGSAGDVRARELARNECPEKWQNMVERAEGRDIGLDRRYT